MENSYNFILVLYTCTANYLLCCKYEHCWIIILLAIKAKKKLLGKFSSSIKSIRVYSEYIVSFYLLSNLAQFTEKLPKRTYLTYTEKS